MLVKLSHLETKQTEKKKSIKGIEGKYGKKSKPQYDALAIVDRYLPSKQGKSVAQRAEGAVERIFFTFEKEEVKQEEEQSKTIAVRTEDEGMISKLKFEEKMRFVFDDKESLALKSL